MATGHFLNKYIIIQSYDTYGAASPDCIPNAGINKNPLPTSRRERPMVSRCFHPFLSKVFLSEERDLSAEVAASGCCRSLSHLEMRLPSRAGNDGLDHCRRERERERELKCFDRACSRRRDAAPRRSGASGSTRASLRVLGLPVVVVAATHHRRRR